MKKVLITLPNSIAGTLILNGFAQGFKSNSCFVRVVDLRDLDVSYLKNYKPDIIFGYDYGFLFSDNEDLKSYIIENQNNFELIHYFADEPNGKYALVDKPYLYNDYLQINARTYIWEKRSVSAINNSKYLPLAVNYKRYRAEDSLKYNISFVGRPLSDKRQLILSNLIKVFGKNLNIFCYEKHFEQSVQEMQNKKLLNINELEIYKSCYRGFLKTEQELANVYFNSRVNLNITIQGDSNLNYRVFEVLASRGFLLTDNMAELKDMFEISRELDVYNNIDDLIDKINFYLKNRDIAEKIGLLGFANVVKKHSYTSRVKMILEDLK